MNFIRRIFRKPEPFTPHEMVAYLLDKSGDLGSRDDVAMDLGKFDLEEVENALIQVTLDHTEEEMIIDSAGESLWEVWTRRNKFNSELVEKMHPSAQKFFRKNDV
jgi:hypothetical protein